MLQQKSCGAKITSQSRITERIFIRSTRWIFKRISFYICCPKIVPFILLQHKKQLCGLKNVNMWGWRCRKCLTVLKIFNIFYRTLIVKSVYDAIYTQPYHWYNIWQLFKRAMIETRSQEHFVYYTCYFLVPLETSLIERTYLHKVADHLWSPM